ncbi:hypothetical protein NEMBOFW57_006598 [Staphylotrichum longicolle]|uniref:Clr5 domain-containing protein n=1 Tax=Staphylotrichum longicolle TaxID=669026 RepID=A0AAD4EXD0_9PEZI|nr:hypothetical protein NEMBOFW57_006598 [Staphylotrichum longicolle]
MATFIIGHRPNAARIPDDVWEKFKPIIVEKYETMTLVELRNWMEQEHSFSATTRRSDFMF